MAKKKKEKRKDLGQKCSTCPKSLKDVKAQHGQHFSTLVVESVVFSSLDDAEEQEACQACSPDHDEYAIHDLSSMVSAVHGDCYDGQKDKVGSAGNIVELIRLEDDGNGKEDGLICEGDEKADG
jgi:hypothetical protein